MNVNEHRHILTYQLREGQGVAGWEWGGVDGWVGWGCLTAFSVGMGTERPGNCGMFSICLPNRVLTVLSVTKQHVLTHFHISLSGTLTNRVLTDFYLSVLV